MKSARYRALAISGSPVTDIEINRELVLSLACELRRIASNGADDFTEHHPLINARIVTLDNMVGLQLRKNDCNAVHGYVTDLIDKLKPTEDEKIRFHL